jgi:hypothetical protein
MITNEQHDAHVRDREWELQMADEIALGLDRAETYAEKAWLRAAEYDPEADAFDDYERSLGKF